MKLSNEAFCHRQRMLVFVATVILVIAGVVLFSSSVDYGGETATLASALTSIPLTEAPSLTTLPPVISTTPVKEIVSKEPVVDTTVKLVDRPVVIIYGDDAERAVQFIGTKGEWNSGRLVLVFSDERVFTSTSNVLRGSNVSGSSVLLGECGPRLVVQRVILFGSSNDAGREIEVTPCGDPPASTATRVSRWASIASGAFLLDAVGAVLSFHFPGPSTTDGALFIASQAAVVAVDPQEVWFCGKAEQAAERLIQLFRPQDGPSEESAKVGFVQIPRSLGTRRATQTVRHATKMFVGKYASSFQSYQRLAHSDTSTFVSPYVFGGSKKSLLAVVAAVNALRERSQTPDGFAFEMVLAAALEESGSSSSSSVNNEVKVRFISERDVLMMTPKGCSTIQRCAVQQSADTSSAAAQSTLPMILLNTRHCMWSKPMKPAPLVQPTCHSKWFDDYYLLHEGNSDAKQFPKSVALPGSLGAVWTAKRTAAPITTPASAKQHLRLCVGKGRSAVLGMCAGYTPQMVATFVKTFAKFHRRSCTQLYLFVDEGQRGAYNATYGGEPDVVIVGIDALRNTLKLQSCGAVHWRKELFYEWLLLKERSEEDANWLRYVMVVDTRDAHFQADPFEPLRAMVPEVQRRLERVQRSSTPGADAGVLYLLPERFEAGVASFFEAGIFELQRQRVSDSCGADTFDWGLNVSLAALLPIDASSSEAHAHVSRPLETHGLINSGLYFGDYTAMKAALKLLAVSMAGCGSSNVSASMSASATTTFTTACGTSNDQGMLHCLGMGGFDNVRFPHDVVMLNPDTHPYTHMFRFESFIQFYEPGTPREVNDRFENAFVYPCTKSMRTQISPRKSDDRTSVGPYAVVHQAEYETHYNFYVTEKLGRL